MLDMTRRLVEHQAAGDELFYQEEAAATLDDGGDGDVGLAQPRRAARRPCSAALAFHT